MILFYLPGKLTAMDQDVGQSFYFTLVDNQDIFMLAADNTMTTKVSLSHEQKPIYNVTVRCTDNGIPAAFVCINSDTKGVGI